MKNNNFYQKLKLAQLSINDINQDKAYQQFQKSYQDSTGDAWNKDRFLERAKNWKFYGDENGYVAVRPQRSGPLKLTGISGSPKSALKGFDKLIQQGNAVWGCVSKQISDMATRRGLIKPNGLIVKALSSIIPANVFGDAKIKKVQFDGGIVFDYKFINAQGQQIQKQVIKYFICNKKYLQHLLQNSQVPDLVKQMIQKIL